MKNFNERKLLWLIFLIALIIRIVFVLIFPLNAPDSGDYDSYALHILKGLGFSTNLARAPLYPSFLAVIYFVFGHNFLAVRVIQAVLGAIICVFAYFIGKRIFKDNKKSALFSAILAIFSPSLIASNSYILTETLYTFLLTISVIFLMKAWEEEKIKNWITGGIFLGFSTLTRPVTLLFPLFLLLILLFYKERIKNFIFILIFSLSMLVVILPWTIRNYIVFKEFIPIGTGGGFNLWVGSYLPWNGDYNWKDLSDAKNLVKGLSQIDADRKFFHEGIKNIKNNPFDYSLLCLKKIGRLWLQIPGGKVVLARKKIQKILIFAFQYIVLIFFLLGLYLCIKKKIKEAFIPVSMIFYFTFIHMFLLAIPRYRIPVMPFVFAITGGGLYSAIEMIKLKMKN